MSGIVEREVTSNYLNALGPGTGDPLDGGPPPRCISIHVKEGPPLSTLDERGKLVLLHHGSRVPKGSLSRKVNNSLTTWRSMQGDALLKGK